MPFNETVVPCPPNAWTSVAQWLDRRKVLRIQCPQIAPTLKNNTVTATAGTSGPLIAANELRLSLQISSSIPGNQVWVGTTDGVTSNALIQVRSITVGSPSISVLSVDSSWNGWYRQPWTFDNTGATD